MIPRKRSLAIVKLGGSLLDWPGLCGALEQFLAEFSVSHSHLLIVIGGGKLADAIRDADAVHQLGDHASHALAIRAMQLSALIVQQIIRPRAQVLQLVSELDSWLEQTATETAWIAILDPLEFLEQHEPQMPGAVLPASWDVTSDSIAARLAQVQKASELVLLKSVDAPSRDADDLAKLAIVDKFFPEIAGSIAWRIVNLRAFAAR